MEQNIVDIAVENGYAAESVVIKELTGGKPTKRSSRASVKGRKGEVVFCYDVTSDDDVKAWLIGENWCHRGYVEGDLYWKLF